ncbi:M16 family metallopeptidase [Flavobacterium sp.]|uniref:M16 family metallopeptidase n=1 Tax=Flavobacterium sp. TaxID=239 RepID=UPI002BB0F3BA|nr:insulinase family protein [Flavobacterium sp.]HSD09289.1 insulinase family protein [Flavobacterium sp.]
MKYLFKTILLVALFPIITIGQELKETDSIPIDPTVKIGKLKNGLTYYIRKNGKPENKVDLRLVVNAGSILEDDNQQGLAHFMEHMNFNGTKHFPKNKLVDYLQTIGVKFGQHLNAYTSFDETVYFLPIPSDSPEKLENGFNIIEDWAFNANLTPEDIEKERGVVLEEYRLGLGADARMRDKYWSKLFYKSKYAERMPIGKKEILAHFKADEIIRFYKDWYRPDLMSVIVVGDIDVNLMEQKIKAHFENHGNPKNEKKRILSDVPNHSETFVAIESDKEATNTMVSLIYKDSGLPEKTKTVGQYKKKLTEGIIATMLNTRFYELTNAPTPPFTYGYSFHGVLNRAKDTYQSVAMVQEDKQLSGLKVLINENERAKKYGFTQAELDRAKASTKASYDATYNERDKQNSDSYVGQYQSNFLTQTPIPSIEWAAKTTEKLLQAINLMDINTLMKDYVKEENRVVVITAPEKEGLKKVTEQEVLNTLKVNPDEITPSAEKKVVTSLLRNEVKPGTIIKKETNTKMDTTTFFLSNGAKVVYKKTNFQNADIIMEGISFGGTNLYSDDELKKTQLANFGLTQAGFSGMNLNEISQFMAGKIASANPYISDITEGIKGSATADNFEYLFQIIHAYFTDLNLDQEAFDGFKQKMDSYLKNIASQPNVYFQQEFDSFLNKNNPRYIGIPNEATWKQTDYTLAYNKYKERFANAADFEFYFVGNVEDKIIENFSCKYLASLPSNNDKHEKAVDSKYKWIKGDLKKVVNKGTDPKSTVTINYYGYTKYSGKEALALKALGEILAIKLTEELRENESEVYGINTQGSINKIPAGKYNFTIGFPCGPENVEKLIASALKELQKITDNGPEDKDLKKFKEAELLEYKKNSKENWFWLNNFTGSFINGESAEEVFNTEAKINKITAKDIQKVAQKYLTKDKTIGILMPETK